MDGPAPMAAWRDPADPRHAITVEQFMRMISGLRKNGHFLGGEALQSARNAVTLRHQNGKVSVTDGPFAGTKEVLPDGGAADHRRVHPPLQLGVAH